MGRKPNSTEAEIKKPAMLVAGIAAWRVWQNLGGARPDFFAGHGLGEYTALVATGVMEFTDAVSIVAQRGRFMQQATPVGGGAMASVEGLDDIAMREICSQVENGEIVSCANYNAPGMVLFQATMKLPLARLNWPDKQVPWNYSCCRLIFLRIAF